MKIKIGLSQLLELTFYLSWFAVLIMPLIIFWSGVLIIITICTMINPKGWKPKSNINK